MRLFEGGKPTKTNVTWMDLGRHLCYLLDISNQETVKTYSNRFKMLQHNKE
jgi:hypothetical protein